MFDFLDKFEKRMEWIGIAHSIINRKGKNTAIEELFDDNELTNIIISVLLFIMEKTLEDNNECDMQQIEGFVDDLINQFYNVPITRRQAKDIADYIVKHILQNNGQKYEYLVKNYSKKTTDIVAIRLIADKIIENGNGKKIVYMLTNQGYEFLFRLREVDEEIQLTIEQLKLKEYIKRQKFSNAVRQSVELISYVRQKKKDIENFIQSIRQNIHSVDIDEYEALIKSTYSMLKEEYETMADIQKMINQAEAKIIEEFEKSGFMSEKLEKAMGEVHQIYNNIGVVISEQRDLIINRHSLTDLYIDTLKKSFEFSFEKRYDFEEMILSSLEKYSNVLDDIVNLFRPLFLPKNRKLLSIAGIYEPQMIFKETEGQGPLLIDIDEYDDRMEKERIARINERYVNVVRLFLEEVMGTGETTLSDILTNVKSRAPKFYKDLLVDKCIFNTALKLYDIGTLPISRFFSNKNKILMNPTEEFNVEYCLKRLQGEIPGLQQVKELVIMKCDGMVKDIMTTETDVIRTTEIVEMSDIVFRVVR
jgi:hypothetical protein